MSNCPHHVEQDESARPLIAAFAVIAVFMAVEVVGGVLSGSLALLADATHMLTDAFALGLAASAQIIARRPADVKRHFGYRRVQVLAAFVNGVLLSILLLWIVYEAIMRILNPVVVNADAMLFIAVIGLGANAVAFLILHGARREDLNVRGALLHVAGDLLGSIAAIAAAIVIMTTGWRQIDPILSVFVAVLIAGSAIRLMKETGHILLEGAPANIDVEALIAGVKAAAPDVEDVHDVHIWQLTPEHARITLHARVSDQGAWERTLAAIKTYLEVEQGIEQSTVQIEIGEACPDEEPHAHSRVVARAPAPPQHHHGHAGAAFLAGQK